MKKILAIGGSNSSTSINQVFANYIAHQIAGATVTVFDWKSHELPLYNPDDEKENGVHENAIKFKQLIDESDAIVLSLAEYNGLHSSAFKNLWDWTSRLGMRFWANKPMFLASSSPGPRGGGHVLKVTKELMTFFDGNVVAEFSLPNFYDNFQDAKIQDEALAKKLNEQINQFQQAL